jgi:peptidoglycan/xylan/chitin deacetylase (PgdA/CDA1 family)
VSYDRGIPVLLYHGLWSDPAHLVGRSAAEARYWVEAREFAAHVAHLAAQGYTTISLHTLLSLQEADLPNQPFILTFDDGWASDWHLAAPVLQRRGWRAELFVTAGRVGQPGFMTWEDVREAAAAGMGIQSHSLTHPDLDRIDSRQLRYELEASKGLLEEHLGKSVDFFALPGGTGRNPEVARVARAVGYRGICTSYVGLNFAQTDPFCWHRIPITRTTSLPQLAAWVKGRGLTTLAWQRSVFRFARRCLGPSFYEWVKAKLTRS